jgi:hypothetical protein
MDQIPPVPPDKPRITRPAPGVKQIQRIGKNMPVVMSRADSLSSFQRFGKIIPVSQQPAMNQQTNKTFNPFSIIKRVLGRTDAGSNPSSVSSK